MEVYRHKVFDYIKKKYGEEPDYPWMDSPGAAVIRHRENTKWYALIMGVKRDRLGLEGDDITDIINVKCDKLMIGSLLQNDGYLPAYHMNKENWITIILDGSVPIEEICSLIDISYGMTMSKRKGKKRADTRTLNGQ